MGVIYKITSPSGKIYVGKSINLKKRIKDYKYQCRRKRKSLVNSSIISHGWANHTIEIIEECANELLSEREIFWIKELKSYWENNPKGMNMTLGGEAGGGSWMWNIERRKYFSELFKGEGSPFYGKKHTEETKRTIGEKAKKRNLESGRRVPKWGAEKGRLKIIKPILCYSADGNFVCEYESAFQASRELSINRGSIVDSLRFGTWPMAKYCFKYKTNNYPLKIEVGEIDVKNVKRPVYWLSEDLEPICEFPSAKEASDFFGIPKTTINRAAMYNDMNPIRLGHIFIYKDMYLKEYKISA